MPLAAVWELTMKCDQACGHCGTRAGRARPNELTTDEVRGVGVALARLGCREVSLIGGEAYLREDIHAIIAMLKDLGMRVVMQTGGRGVTPELARSLAEAGLSSMGVSVDGPALVHDKLRGSIGSHRAALSALDAAREAGLLTSSNTQVNRLNHHLLRETCTELRAHGIESWQVQLTVPMGRAADRPEWIIEPWMIVDVLRTLAELQLEAVREPSDPPFNVICGNNLGYFGPYEAILRSRPGSGVVEHWAGCTAGVNVIGIESDGVVKGCPSLPTAPYTGGNIRDLSLEQIWEHAEELRFNRERSLDDLWGYCRSCYYAEICRGGCSWMSHCTLGRRGNNPFCYHRVTQLQKRGIRERLVPVAHAPNRPYDFGRFELQSEPWPEDLPPYRHGPV
jgi:radical SAM protein with 4Fe4S-binding SPASM domain